MRNKIQLHLQLSVILFLPTALLVCLFAYSIYSIEQKKLVTDIDEHYESLLDNYNSNLNTIKNYHKNHQAILLFDNKTARIIRDLFASTHFKEKLYPFVLDAKGQLLIHPFSEGADVSQTYWGAKILNSKLMLSVFNFFSEEYKVENRLYFIKNSGYDVVIGIVGEEQVIYEDFYKARRILIISTLIFLVLLGVLIYQLVKTFLQPIRDLYMKLKQFSTGNWNERLNLESSKEFSLISKIYNKTAENISSSTLYAQRIGNGKIDEELRSKLQDSSLTESLMKIEKNIQSAIEVEELRKIEDEKLKWFNQGIATFGEVLRLSTNSIEELADNIIQNLVKYVGANQGGVFTVNSDDPHNSYLELISAFAFDSKKFLEKKILIGEGLVGTCAVEMKTIYIKQAPDSYISITSGLGDAPPRTILIVPVKLEEQVLGVIEIASFSDFEKHQIAFIEKIMESVAATLSSSKINQQTKELLQKFEIQSKEMAEQEEEMRQNIEELTATQEEASSRELELKSIIQAFSGSLKFIEFDSEFKILDLNENFSILFDLQYEATFGKSLNDLILINKAKFIDIDNALSTIRNGGEIEESHTYKIDGIDKMIMDRYIPVKNQNGELSKIIRIATVIS